MSFSVLSFGANERTKENIHPLQGPPYIGRMQTENCRNRQFSVGFGKPGHGLEFLSAGAECKAELKKKPQNLEFIQKYRIFAPQKESNNEYNRD